MPVTCELPYFQTGDFNVDSEKDADAALQLSNSLTQALLNYRMQSLAGQVHKEIYSGLIREGSFGERKHHMRS